MIIRSQDKRVLVNFNNVASICCNGRDTGLIEAMYPAATENSCLFDVLGCYSTKEKSIKVLDMITDSYARFRGGNVYTDSAFQMPQDNEVTV